MLSFIWILSQIRFKTCFSSNLTRSELRLVFLASAGWRQHGEILAPISVQNVKRFFVQTVICLLTNRSIHVQVTNRHFKKTLGHIKNSRLSRCSTARRFSTGLFHEGPTKVKAYKSFLFTEGSHKVWNKYCVALWAYLSYILFWYQSTINWDVTECECGKTKSAPALQRDLAYVRFDQT